MDRRLTGRVEWSNKRPESSHRERSGTTPRRRSYMDVYGYVGAEGIRQALRSEEARQLKVSPTLADDIIAKVLEPAWRSIDDLYNNGGVMVSPMIARYELVIGLDNLDLSAKGNEKLQDIGILQGRSNSMKRRYGFHSSLQGVYPNTPLIIVNKQFTTAFDLELDAEGKLAIVTKDRTDANEQSDPFRKDLTKLIKRGYTESGIGYQVVRPPTAVIQKIADLIILGKENPGQVSRPQMIA